MTKSCQLLFMLKFYIGTIVASFRSDFLLEILLGLKWYFREIYFQSVNPEKFTACVVLQWMQLMSWSLQTTHEHIQVYSLLQHAPTVVITKHEHNEQIELYEQLCTASF